MQKELVLDRAREVAQRDAQMIHDAYEQLSGSSLGSLAETARRIVDSTVVDTSGTGPRPALRLLNAAYEDLTWGNPSPEPDELQAIGGLLARLSEVEAPPAHKKATVKTGETATACQAAEEHFAYGLLQMTRGRYIQHRKLSVYHDQAGEPLLFQKQEEEDTALTLLPLSLGSLTLPAGTLVTVDQDMAQDASGRSRARDFQMESFLAPEAVSICPVRASAWVYNRPVDRALFAVRGSVNKEAGADHQYLQYFEHKAALLGAVSLDHFVAASRKVMRLCAG